MTVSFKQFATFLSLAEGQPAEKLDEIWSKILGKKKEDEDKKKDDYFARVKSAHAKLNGKKTDDDDDDETAAEKRKKELQKKRDDEWAKAKDRMNTPAKPAGRGDHRGADVRWHLEKAGPISRLGEGQEHFTLKADWEAAVQAAGFKVKKLNDTKWGAFDEDQKVGELKDLGSRFDGWLIVD